MYESDLEQEIDEEIQTVEDSQPPVEDEGDSTQFSLDSF